MLNEIRSSYQLTFRHEDDDDVTIISTNLLFSKDTMAGFRIMSPLLCPHPVTYVLSWYNSKCWLIDPIDHVSAFFDLPLNIDECIDELIDKDFEDDVAEELANVVSLVYNTVTNDPGLIDYSDELPF